MAPAGRIVRDLASAAALLLAGIVLGPHGIALLSAGTLALLAPAVPVGIGALGVLLGLSVAPGNADGRRVALPASVSVLVTLAIVGGGLMLAARAEYATLAPAVLVLVTGAAVCAATAPVLPAGHPLEPRSREVRTAELGVLLSILAGSGVLAWLQSGTRVPAGLSIAAAAGLIVALALAVWLLLTVASNETEERVLTVSALLLVGGVSDALATPALLGGVAAGCVWRYAGGPPVTSLNRDVLFVQHPLIVGLLLLAGAAADLSRASWVFAALYVALRVVGRLAGAIAARRVGGVSSAPTTWAGTFLSPGITAWPSPSMPPPSSVPTPRCCSAPWCWEPWAPSWWRRCCRRGELPHVTPGRVSDRDRGHGGVPASSPIRRPPTSPRPRSRSASR